MLPGWCCIANRHIGAIGNGDSWYHMCAFRFHFWGRKVNWNQASHVRASSVFSLHSSSRLVVSLPQMNLASRTTNHPHSFLTKLAVFLWSTAIFGGHWLPQSNVAFVKLRCRLGCTSTNLLWRALDIWAASDAAATSCLPAAVLPSPTADFDCPPVGGRYLRHSALSHILALTCELCGQCAQSGFDDWEKQIWEDAERRGFLFDV